MREENSMREILEILVFFGGIVLISLVFLWGIVTIGSNGQDLSTSDCKPIVYSNGAMLNENPR